PDDCVSISTEEGATGQRSVGKWCRPLPETNRRDYLKYLKSCRCPYSKIRKMWRTARLNEESILSLWSVDGLRDLIWGACGHGPWIEVDQWETIGNRAPSLDSSI